MGFDAQYQGQLVIEPPLNETEKKALDLFLDARHMKTVHGPLDIRRSLTQSHPDVVDWSAVAQDMPSLHAGLRLGGPNTLEWDGNEGAGDLTSWVRYVIDYFLRPAGVFAEKAKLVPEDDLLHGFTFDHTVNGTMTGMGGGEAWRIEVEDNEVSMVEISEKE